MSDFDGNTAQNVQATCIDDPILGLVCVTFSDEVRFRTITRTNYLKLDETERRRKLEELYSENLRRVYKAIDFCQQRGIRLYRLSSSLFPMSDEMLGTQILEEMAGEMAGVAPKAEAAGIRLVLHPDQFIVLSSDSPQIVETSRMLMERHARTLDLFGLPRTTWTATILHGGKGGRSERLIEVIKDLPDEVRCRLVLENDEHAYGAEEILEVCQRTGVPMVFDVHHHVVHDKLDSYEHESVPRLLAAARTTWPVAEWQMVHLSNGDAKFNDPRHSDFISIIPSSFRQKIWIEVEAKAKEEAITRLQNDWHNYTANTNV